MKKKVILTVLILAGILVSTYAWNQHKVSSYEKYSLSIGNLSKDDLPNIKEN